MNEPAVAAFLKRWGNIPEEAINNALRSAFPDLHRLSPPVDLAELANLRNVASIRNLELPVDGMISLLDGRYVIELNKSHSNERRRFTLAHELGHTFFLEMETVYSGARMRVVDTNLELRGNYEERLCNTMAAEMLMPRIPFKKVLKEVGLCARNIVEIAQLFRSSVQATARRWVECSRFRLLIALWEFRPETETFFAKWVAKAPGIRLNTKRLLLTKRDPIFDMFKGVSGSYRGRKWISIGGSLDDYFVDAIVFRASNPRQILTLFVLDPMAESIVSDESVIKRSEPNALLFV